MHAPRQKQKQSPWLLLSSVKCSTFKDTLSLLLQKSVAVVFKQDIEALIKILKTGYSPKLQHVGRVHRINVASVAEILAEDSISCDYCPTQDQVANGLTKVILPSEWPRMLQQLCLELPSETLALVAIKPLVTPAECFALHVQLLFHLPAGVADRASDQTNAHAFTVGAFSRGISIAGVCTLTRLFLNVSKLLCRRVRSP